MRLHFILSLAICAGAESTDPALVVDEIRDSKHFRMSFDEDPSAIHDWGAARLPEGRAERSHFRGSQILPANQQQPVLAPKVV